MKDSIRKSFIDLSSALCCPFCREKMMLTEDGKSLVCQGGRRHCFDISASGYVNLLPSHPGGGDSRDAVRARSAFLNSGHYAPVADTLCAVLAEHLPQRGIVIDAGCGEGYYSARIAQDGFDVIGFDLSKYAVESAAKRSVRENASGGGHALFGVAGIFNMPVPDSCASAVTNIFAPCAPGEYGRVLRDGGILAVVSAGPLHLMGLKSLLYETAYENGDRADLPSDWKTAEQRRLTYDITLDTEDEIMNLFSMTPYYWRTSAADRDKLTGRGSLKTPVDVVITVYNKPDIYKETI